MTQAAVFAHRFRERRAARTEDLRAQLDGIGHGTRAAQVLWSLEQRDPDHVGLPIGQQHPGVAAIMAVRRALSELALPALVQCRWVGTHRAAGSGAHALTEGRVDVELSFRSLSDVLHTVQVPVMVHQGRVLIPSTFIDQGEYQLISQASFDELLDRTTMSREELDRRTMFSPPLDLRRPTPSRVPLIRPGIFGIAAQREQLDLPLEGEAPEALWPCSICHREFPQSEVRWYENRDPDTGRIMMPEVACLSCLEGPDPDRDWDDRHGDIDVDGKTPRVDYRDEQVRWDAEAQARVEEAERAKLRRRQRTSPAAPAQPWMTAPYETPGPQQHARAAAGPELPARDVGEREPSALGEGAPVKLRREVDVIVGGGARLRLPKGAKGTVIRDHDGSGQAFDIRFEDLGVAARIRSDALAPARRR